MAIDEASPRAAWELGVPAAAMRAILGHFCTGVAVVTGLDDSGPLGLTCQSLTSVSLEPPYVAFCPSNTSSSWPPIRATGRMCINVLADDQRRLCAQFARSGTNKFAGVQWTRSRNGAPALAGALAVIEAELEFEHGAGDHTIVVAHVTGLQGSDDRRPLLFYRGGYGSFDTLNPMAFP